MSLCELPQHCQRITSFRKGYVHIIEERIFVEEEIETRTEYVWWTGSIDWCTNTNSLILRGISLYDMDIIVKQQCAISFYNAIHLDVMYYKICMKARVHY
jgi:hypothetical protein